MDRIETGYIHEMAAAIVANDVDHVRSVLIAAGPLVQGQVLVPVPNSGQALLEQQSRPLDLAVTLERTEIVTLLMSHGADPLVADSNGETAVSLAASGGRLFSLVTILSRLDDVQMRSTAVFEALLAAIRNGHTQAAMGMLLACGRRILRGLDRIISARAAAAASGSTVVQQHIERQYKDVLEAAVPGVDESTSATEARDLAREIVDSPVAAKGVEVLQADPATGRDGAAHAIGPGDQSEDQKMQLEQLDVEDSKHDPGMVALGHNEPGPPRYRDSDGDVDSDGAAPGHVHTPQRDAVAHSTPAKEAAPGGRRMSKASVSSSGSTALSSYLPSPGSSGGRKAGLGTGLGKPSTALLLAGGAHVAFQLW